MPTFPLPELPATRRALEALTGRPARVLGPEALEAVRAGAKVIAVLPWRERREERYLPLIQVHVRRIEGGRVFFENPVAVPAEPGQELGGGAAGPLRRREAGGLESMPVATFEALLRLGGRVVVP